MSENAVITPRLMKTRLAAHYLSVSEWKIRNLVQEGEIACIIGEGTSPWLFDMQDLDDWVERQKRTL
jgi:excisionase family DNA binding protein